MPLWLALICIAVAAGVGFVSGAVWIIFLQASATLEVLAAFDESHAAERAQVGY